MLGCIKNPQLVSRISAINRMFCVFFQINWGQVLNIIYEISTFGEVFFAYLFGAIFHGDGMGGFVGCMKFMYISTKKLETWKHRRKTEMAAQKISTNLNDTVFVLNLIVWLFAPLMLTEMMPTSKEALLRVEIFSYTKQQGKGIF